MKTTILLSLLTFSLVAGAAEKKIFPQNTQRVLPEISTQVVLSNRDVNRLVCESGEAVKPVFSTEKPVDVKVSSDRRSFWVKFKYLSQGGENHYYAEPTELFLTCGTSTFELIVLPKYENPHKIMLGSDTKESIKANQALFSALSLEEAAVSLWGSRDFPSKNDKVLWRPRRPWPPEGYYFSLTGKYPSIERISSS
ncbi:type-F conjugative transfer system secretin TraK, partial [Citrobacter freundii]|uniref:TraK domain-containing protein n=1 Tax=Citrobacter freundii TaxID=546 RepID=UPI00374E35BD